MSALRFPQFVTAALLLALSLLALSLLALSGCDLFSQDAPNRCAVDADCAQDYRCVITTCEFKNDDVVFGPACPVGEVCLGDAIRDFDFTQGSKSGLWNYLWDDRHNTLGEMTLVGDDDIVRWMDYDAPAPQPQIFYCPSHPNDPRCLDAEDEMLMQPSLQDEGYHDPVLSFVAPSDGTYDLTGVLRFVATDVAYPDIAVTVSRQYAQDTVFTHLLRPNEPISFVGRAELLAGERLNLTTRNAGFGQAAPIAMFAHVIEREPFPGKCQLAMRFEDSLVTNLCGDLAYQPRQERHGSALDFTPFFVDSAFETLGRGLHLNAGDFLAPTGPPMDYADQFTMQMWLRLPSFSDGTLYSDWSQDSQLGLNISVTTSGDLVLDGLYENEGTFGVVQVAGAFPTDGGWHFVRFVRNADSQRFSLCIDGSLAQAQPVDGVADFSPPVPPMIGRSALDAEATFLGTLDDVRVLRRALPCE